jgi:hypothetical protein
MCAWQFGDSYDCYAAVTDALAGYWDSGNAGTVTLQPGRFSGSQALNFSSGATTTITLIKSSGANDGLHHITCAFWQSAALSGTTAGLSFQLQDGTTSQCSVVFRSDGAILLTSGSPIGTTLATYSGAVTATSTWFAFEIEVFISNTAGYMNVRKNGNTVNDFSSATNLNTRGGTANNYANRLAVVMYNAVSAQRLDDLYWRSDASSVPWLGDIRCYTRMPASDAAVQFSHAPGSAPVTQTPVQATSASKAANAGCMTVFIANYTGTISSGTVSILTGGTGNMKAAIYDVTRTTALATSNAVVNPASGMNAITFPIPLAVTKGTSYYLAVDQDTTIVYNTTNASNGFQFTTTYASFPATSPTATAAAGPIYTLNIGLSQNYETVNEAQQDATTSYVYSSTPGHSDLYGIAAIASTPLVTHAVTVRAYAIKSDAGTRTMAAQLKSGGTTVASPTIVLTPSNWQWAWRTDQVDPATGAAWTAAAVNVALVGPTVIA